MLVITPTLAYIYLDCFVNLFPFFQKRQGGLLLFSFAGVITCKVLFVCWW